MAKVKITVTSSTKQAYNSAVFWARILNSSIGGTLGKYRAALWGLIMGILYGNTYNLFSGLNL